jgi:hypothetical protein
MSKFLNIKNVIAIVLVLAGLGIELRPYIPNFVVPKPDVAILNIDKPNDTIISIVNPVSDLITDPTDRAKMAIFSQEFANRLKGYDADLQQVNDVMALAAQKFFQESMKDKYEGLDDSIIKLITSTVGSDDNSKLNDEEKLKLSEVFMGFAWALIQKK